MTNQRSERNKTITLEDEEIRVLSKKLVNINKKTEIEKIVNKTINQDILDILELLPEKSVDLMFIDPPYNLRKSFNGNEFKKTSVEEFNDYIDSWLPKMIRLLKPGASVYICGDWYTSTSIYLIASKYLKIQNRITWQREKGRGAKLNWKNSSEDIWFCTVDNKYKFYVDRVKEKRQVIAPYKVDGKPKDWEESQDGKFRLTHPSNIWTDISVPYWSMSENTEHPTQKPEKLLAKIILAGSDEGDVIFDPFLGSGTTSVVAKKLDRKYLGVEMDVRFACIAEKRLAAADSDKKIQGYEEGVFWERNTSQLRRRRSTSDV
jgi:site-specific DNA-methyltransferase (adenine-specific)